MFERDRLFASVVLIFSIIGFVFMLSNFLVTPALVGTPENDLSFKYKEYPRN